MSLRPGRTTLHSHNMKGFLIVSAFIGVLASPVFPQMRVIYLKNVKAVTSPLPSFPAEAKGLIYGDEVRVVADIDADGRVKAALGVLASRALLEPG